MHSKIHRCWVNQPSTLQPGHQWHGLNVLADMSSVKDYGSEKGELIDVYFISGDTVCTCLPRNSVSVGWR